MLLSSTMLAICIAEVVVHHALHRVAVVYVRVVLLRLKTLVVILGVQHSRGRKNRASLFVVVLMRLNVLLYFQLPSRSCNYRSVVIWLSRLGTRMPKSRYLCPSKYVGVLVDNVLLPTLSVHVCMLVFDVFLIRENGVPVFVFRRRPFNFPHYFCDF